MYNWETESLLIAAQNNSIRTNYVQAKIDKMQQNSKCRLYSNEDEIINHIISECSKLAQKECKSRHNRLGKVIYGELCKKLKFDNMNKWYICTTQNPSKRMKHKLLCDFEMQTDHLISAWQPNIVIVNKKKVNLLNSGLCCLGRP